MKSDNITMNIDGKDMEMIPDRMQEVMPTCIHKGTRNQSNYAKKAHSQWCQRYIRVVWQNGGETNS